MGSDSQAMPAVAATDSWKPIAYTSVGSIARSRRTAPPRIAGGLRRVAEGEPHQHPRMPGGQDPAGRPPQGRSNRIRRAHDWAGRMAEHLELIGADRAREASVSQVRAELPAGKGDQTRHLDPLTRRNAGRGAAAFEP